MDASLLNGHVSDRIRLAFQLFAKKVHCKKNVRCTSTPQGVLLFSPSVVNLKRFCSITMTKMNGGK